MDTEAWTDAVWTAVDKVAERWGAAARPALTRLMNQQVLTRNRLMRELHPDWGQDWLWLAMDLNRAYYLWRFGPDPFYHAESFIGLARRTTKRHQRARKRAKST